MTVAGVTMVRDELDVIEPCLRHMADEVDVIVVADNMSRDGTRKVLDELRLPVPLRVIDDPDPAYRQSEKMSALAVLAATQYGAEWIVPFDADEMWLAGHRVSTVLEGMPAEVNAVEATLWNHFASALDLAGDNPFLTMEWRQRDPGALPKVAFRWSPGAVIHQGNHGVTLPGGEVWGEERLKVRHFPYRSPEQMVRKARNGAAAYAASDLPQDMGRHWRSYGDLIDRFGEEALHDVFRTYFWSLSPVDAGMVYDPAPWCRWRR